MAMTGCDGCGCDGCSACGDDGCLDGGLCGEECPKEVVAQVLAPVSNGDGVFGVTVLGP